MTGVTIRRVPLRIASARHLQLQMRAVSARVSRTAKDFRPRDDDGGAAGLAGRRRVRGRGLPRRRGLDSIGSEALASTSWCFTRGLRTRRCTTLVDPKSPTAARRSFVVDSQTIPAYTARRAARALPR